MTTACPEEAGKECEKRKKTGKETCKVPYYDKVREDTRPVTTTYVAPSTPRLISYMGNNVPSPLTARNFTSGSRREPTKKSEKWGGRTFASVDGCSFLPWGR